MAFYLGVIIVTPYLLPGETPYSQFVRNSLIIFGPFEMEIGYKEHQHTTNC